MPNQNETQSIAPESQCKDISNEAAWVLTQSSLFQPGTFDVTSYAKDLLECDSTTTMHNALANTSFAIIERAPSRNLVSYSFSSEEEITGTTVKVSDNMVSQCQSEVMPLQILIDDTVEAQSIEHQTIEVSSDNQVVEIYPSQDNLAEKDQQECVYHEGVPVSSQYQLQESATCNIEALQVAGSGSDKNLGHKEDINEHKDANNNAKCTNKEQVQRNKQTLLDRWLQLRCSDEQRQFKCNSCDHEFFTEASLDMHFKNAHVRKSVESSNEESEGDVTAAKHCESSEQHKGSVELQFEAVEIDADVCALLAAMLSSVEQ